jgi:hypothetical protein
VPSQTEEIGYITEDRPRGREEIDIAVTLAPKVVTELSIYRSLREPGFRDDELARLSDVVPVQPTALRDCGPRPRTAASTIPLRLSGKRP